MDPISATAAVNLPTDIGSSFQAQSTPSASPELVAKFESLMSRVSLPSGADPGAPVVPSSAVNAVDAHLQHHADVIERIQQLKTGEMSMADIQVMQMQSMVQMGMMSMTQTAYLQVLGTSKSTVSALMKNQ